MLELCFKYCLSFIFWNLCNMSTCYNICRQNGIKMNNIIMERYSTMRFLDLSAVCIECQADRSIQPNSHKGSGIVSTWVDSPRIGVRANMCRFNKGQGSYQHESIQQGSRVRTIRVSIQQGSGVISTWVDSTRVKGRIIQESIQQGSIRKD